MFFSKTKSCRLDHSMVGTGYNNIQWFLQIPGTRDSIHQKLPCISFDNRLKVYKRPCFDAVNMAKLVGQKGAYSFYSAFCNHCKNSWMRNISWERSVESHLLDIDNNCAGCNTGVVGGWENRGSSQAMDNKLRHSSMESSGVLVSDILLLAKAKLSFVLSTLENICLSLVAQLDLPASDPSADPHMFHIWFRRVWQRTP